MPDELTRAVRQALTMAPGSVNGLAEAADVWQSDLSRILRGNRRASATVARRVADTLAQWASDCTAAAQLIRDAESQHNGERGEE
jgi:transcriptional regulator with XRE-family HTH domain